MSQKTISLSSHDPLWRKAFNFTSSELKKIVSIEIDVHHIGSTSIGGIKAKPILDIMCVVPSLEEFDLQKSSLESRGFIWKGEYGILGRRYCVFHDEQNDKELIHLHVYETTNEEIEKHLLFRDYLRFSQSSATKYDKLKHSLVKECPSARENYTQGKASLIKDLLVEGYKWRTDIFRKLINKILDQNVMIKAVTSLGIPGAGGYVPNSNKCGPTIEILREPYGGFYWVTKEEQYVENINKFIAGSKIPTQDMIILSHEFGHHLSKENGNRTDDYEAALDLFNNKKIANMTSIQKNLIDAEEEKAWDFGKLILEEIDFNDFDFFEIQKEKSRVAYKEILHFE